MRLVCLAAFITFHANLCNVRAVKRRQHIDALLVTVPDKLNPKKEDAKSKSPVNGPITGESSASGVDKTEDMIMMNSSVSFIPSGTEAKSSKDKPSTVINDNGNADQVDQKQMSQEKVAANFEWTLKDLSHPLCRNCKAVVDYKWVLIEYGNAFGTRAILVITMSVLIWLLGTTARDFFVPPLLYWADRLQLSPQIAGATILALGNCAPDIFAVVTAAHKDDLPLAVSEMLGSNMFGLCITGGLMAVTTWYYASERAESMDGGADVEDSETWVPFNSVAMSVLFYFITLAALAFVLMHGQPTVLKTLFLPLIYALYVFALWWVRPVKDTEPVAAPEEDPACEAPVSSAEGGTGDSHHPPPPQLYGIEMPKNATPLDIAVWWLTLPSYILRWACIPPVDGHWGPLRRATSAFSPVGMLVFCFATNLASMQQLSFFTLTGFAMMALLLGSCVYLGSDNRPGLPWFYPALPTFALVAAIIWLAVLAAEITALVEAIGFTMQVPRLQLGYTAVSWGNALTDMLVCLATAQQGHSAMAVTAILAAPLIDDLVAFGMAIIMVSWQQNSVPVLCGADCPKEFKDPLITSLVFIAVAVILLACALRERGPRVKLWAALLAALYVAFLIIVLLVEHVDAPEGKKGTKTV